MERGFNLTVFEKSRGVAGRMSTRRVGDDASFDHGAQYFTVRDSRFRNHVDSWIEKKIVSPWPDYQNGKQKIVVIADRNIESESNTKDRFVGSPSMSAICKHLSTNIEIRKQTLVTKVNSVENKDTIVR